jgi:hypothetical protein
MHFVIILISSDPFFDCSCSILNSFCAASHQNGFTSRGFPDGDKIPVRTFNPGVSETPRSLGFTS